MANIFQQLLQRFIPQKLLVSPTPPHPIYGPPVPRPRTATGLVTPVERLVATPQPRSNILQQFLAPKPSPKPQAPQAKPQPKPSSPAPYYTVTRVPAPYQTVVRQAAQNHGLDPGVLGAALARESANYNPKYVYGYHVDGAGRGMAGIDKRYHPEVTDQQAFNPTFAANWMAQQLASLVKKHGGNVANALREYNGGPAFASNRKGYQGRTVNQLTQAHAKNILGNAGSYSQ